MTVEPSSAPTRLMMVVSKQLPGVVLYDEVTRKPIGRGTTDGICPHEAAFSRDGRFIYMPIYGSSGVGKPGTDEHILHVFRTADCTQAGSLDTGEYKRPHGIAVGQNSDLIYLSAEIAESLIIVDPEDLQIIGAVPTGSNTSHMFALTRDESKAYVSNVRSKTISVLDIENRALLDTIPTDGENQRMTLSPDERWFVTNLGPTRKIAFYRTKDHQLDFSVPVTGTPFVSKFSNDGRFLYCAGFAEPGRLGTWKINVSKRQVMATLQEGLGGDPGSLEVNPFSGSVFVSDQATHSVYEIDPDAWRVVSSIETPKSPDAMAFIELRK